MLRAVPYQLPILHAHLGEASLFRLRTQSLLLRIAAELDLYNDNVAYIRALDEKTFGSLSPENREIIRSNLDKATRKLGERAEIAIRTINELVDSFGKLVVAAR